MGVVKVCMIFVRVVFDIVDINVKKGEFVLFNIVSFEVFEGKLVGIDDYKID